MKSGSWWDGGVQDPGAFVCRGVVMVLTPVGLVLVLLQVLLLSKRAVRHLSDARNVTPLRIAHGSVKRRIGRRATKRRARRRAKEAKPLVTRVEFRRRSLLLSVRDDLYVAQMVLCSLYWHDYSRSFFDLEAVRSMLGARGQAEV